jgi:hypothetical protein
MAAIIKAIEELNSRNSKERISYKKVAQNYGVVASTLRRRFLAQTEPREVKHLRQLLLTPEQEAELIRWINDETRGKQPPAGPLIASQAAILAGKDVGNGWVYRFLKRHEDALVYKRSAPIDRQRAQADSYEKCQAYFTYLEGKVREYQVPADQTYNMDEKGFAMGQMNSSKRAFPRRLWEKKVVRAPLQDGSREWITILACVCADGTTLPPGLIYRSDAAQVWSTWVEDIQQDTEAFVTASISGWTNDDIGLQWLIQVFDRVTKPKARRSWRLLYVDGHGSHVTMAFLEACMARKILVARFPPHATHTLQPLDVVVFKSLSSAYGRELEQVRSGSHGLLPMAKRDFFSIFWRAWNSTFSPSLVLKAFEATGLSPLNPDVILERFEPDSSDGGSDSSGSQLISWNQLNRRFREVVKDENDRRTQHLRLAFHHLYCFAEINQHQVNELEQALATKKKRRKPGKALRDPDSDRESGGAKWWSPRSIQRQILQIEAEQEEARLEEVHKAQKVAQQKRQKAIKDRKKEEAAAARRVAAELSRAKARQNRLDIDARKAERAAKKNAKRGKQGSSKAASN